MTAMNDGSMTGHVRLRLLAACKARNIKTMARVADAILRFQRSANSLRGARPRRAGDSDPRLRHPRAKPLGRNRADQFSRAALPRDCDRLPWSWAQRQAAQRRS